MRLQEGEKGTIYTILEFHQSDDPLQNQQAHQQTQDISLTIGMNRARRGLEKKSTMKDKRDGTVGDGTSSPSIPSFYILSFLQRSNVKDQIKD